MEMTTTPAAAILKGICPEGDSLTFLLGQMFADKGIGIETVRYLAKQSPSFVGALIGHMVLHHPRYSGLASKLQQSLNTIILPEPQYRGLRAENRAVDAAVYSSPVEQAGMRSLIWRGASGGYFGGGLTVPQEMRDVAVLIIGAGAAGILAARALANAGMRNIHILEKEGQIGGIWEMEGIKGAPMAVPFPLNFEQVQLKPAPRPGSDVSRWLRDLVAPPLHFGWPAFPRVLKGKVFSVRPGDLQHTVTYQDTYGALRELTAPIVINAIGVGEPLEPTRPGVMTTDVPAARAGHRWQEVWSDARARQLHGRKLVFVSLSNSTLEMLRQIHEFERQGLEIDYRVITHYPSASLADPVAQVAHGERMFRLYRDPQNFQLLRVAGDLRHVAQAFEQARDTDRIVPHVCHWTLDQGDLVAVLEDGQSLRLGCDELYTLIGYGPRAELLDAMGFLVNGRYLGAVDLDFDTEVQRLLETPGRERVWPGYHGFGIRNAYNPNEVLLPGLVYRLLPLVTNVIFRAAECVAKQG